MGKARILGRDAELFVRAGEKDISVGEIDKFNAKKLDELKKSQPLGDMLPTSNVVHAGWELSFEGGKVDWSLAVMIHAQDAQIQNGGRAPLFQIKQRIEYYDGSVEIFTYKDVSLYGYEVDMGSATDELTEKVSGFASKREMDESTSTTIKTGYNTALENINTSITNLNQQLLLKGTPAAVPTT